MKEKKRPITGGGLFWRNAEHMSRSHHGTLRGDGSTTNWHGYTNRKYRSTNHPRYYHYYYCCCRIFCRRSCYTRACIVLGLRWYSAAVRRQYYSKKILFFFIPIGNRRWKFLERPHIFARYIVSISGGFRNVFDEEITLGIRVFRAVVNSPRSIMGIFM